MCAVSRTIGVVVAFGMLAVLAAPTISLADEPAAAPADKAASASAPSAMHDMQAMHQKMMAAKTPAERQALLADQMKAMQEGMAMMQQMGAQHGKDGMSPQMMQKRMDMMTMMMQMMMDRQPGGMGGMGGMPMMGGAPEKRSP